MENYRVFGNGCQYNAQNSNQNNHLNEENKVQDESSPITIKIAEQQKKALIPLKEDLADWLSKLTGKQVTEQNLFEMLQTGSVLCELAHIIYNSANKSLKHRNRPKSGYVTSANYHSDGSRGNTAHSCHINNEDCKALPTPPKFKPRAQPYSFVARDNAANFISWCRQLGVDESCMFESECLVLQKQPRNVVLCLLDVGRIAARYGVIAPELVQLEQEIEQEERRYASLTEIQSNVGTPKLMFGPSLSTNLKTRAKALKLDDAVHRIVDGPPFDGQVDIERVGEGRYRIEGKLIFVRMLRGHHVMVRVGGGWDTLEHYLVKHDLNRFIPKITAKEICDSVSQDIAAARKQSVVFRTPTKSQSRNVQTATDLVKHHNKGYFVPVSRRPTSALD